MTKNRIATNLLLLSLVAFTGCIRDVLCMKGDGNFTEKTLPTSEFIGITLEGEMDVFITEGPRTVVVKGDQNFLDKLDVAMRSQECRIKMDQGCYTDNNIEVHITTPELSIIVNEGSGTISVDDFIHQSDLIVDVKGSGNVELSKSDSLEDFIFTIDGSGNLICDQEIPNIKNLTATLDASGSANCFLASTENAEITINGSGDCSLTVTEFLDVTINGSGNMNFKGNPNIESRIDGSGSVRNKN